MTIQKETDGLLDLLICPGFCVKNDLITRVNQAASALLIAPGTPVQNLLLTGAEEYAEFHDGCLYLKLNLIEDGWGCAVIRKADTDYFLLDQPSQGDALRAMALAARELRNTMTGTIVSADLLAQQLDPENARLQEQLARLNRGLSRTLRLIGNMSDAQDAFCQHRQEICEVNSMLREIFEKAASLLEAADIPLTYEGLNEAIYSLVNRDQLERAVLNILSNAAKFASQGCRVQASLSRRGKMLRLSIRDNGPGIPENIRGTLFSRYLRQTGIEDSRYGLGLGMVLIQSCAATHGGTVLVDYPSEGGTRVTMTLVIRQESDTQLRSPLLVPDYAGSQDHALLELSDCLPYELYRK